MNPRMRRVLIGLVLLGAAVTAGLVVSRGMADDRTAGAAASTPGSAASTSGSPADADAEPAAGPAGPATPTADVPAGPDPAAESPVLDRPEPVQADVVVTYSGFDPATGAVEVGAYVAGLIEQGGRCTLTLTQGATERTTSAEAVPDARTTSCPALTLDAMTPGTWTGVVGYASAGGATLSRDLTVEVP